MRRFCRVFRLTYLWVLAVPLTFLALGAASNQLVLIANNDLFPVRANIVKIAELTDGDPLILKDGTVILGRKTKNDLGIATGINDDIHCLMTSKTHLNFLADNFDFRTGGINSIGDISFNLGSWLMRFAPYVWITLVVRKLLYNNAN